MAAEEQKGCAAAARLSAGIDWDSWTWQDLQAWRVLMHQFFVGETVKP